MCWHYLLMLLLWRKAGDLASVRTGLLVDIC